MSRNAFANLDADVTDRRTPLRIDDVRRPAALRRLAEVWLQLVEDPPAQWGWLERARGLVPWVATPLAHEAAQARGERLWGAPADVVAALNGRAFVASLADKLEDGDSPFRRVAAVDLRAPEGKLRPASIDVSAAMSAAGIPKKNALLRATVGPWARYVAPSGVVDVTGAPEGLAVLETAEPYGGAPPATAFVDVALSSLWLVDEHGEPHSLGVTSGGRRRDGSRVHEATFGPFGPRAGTRFDDEQLEKSRLVVEEAAARGYRGPCSVEGFLYLRHDKRLALRAAAAFDARFSDGHVALGLWWRQAPKEGSRWRFRIDDVRTIEEVPDARPDARIDGADPHAVTEGRAPDSRPIGRPRIGRASSTAHKPAVVRRPGVKST